MPQFPTYSLPQVRTEPLPGVRFQPGVPSGAFGQPVGQATNYIGRLLGQRAVEMRDQDDQNAAFEALNRASSAVNTYLYGGNGQPGLLGRQGIAALGSTDEASRMFSEIGRQAQQSLESKGARYYFDRHWIQRSGTLESQIAGFEAQQRAVASDQIVGAAKDQAIRDVAQDPTEGTLFDAKSNVFRAYRANGRSDLEIATVFTELDTVAAENQIRTMIRQDPFAAAQALLADDGPFSDRPLEWREQWRERAMTEFEQRSRLVRAQEEQNRREADREQKETEKRLAKEGDALFSKGLLKMNWVEQNAKDLSKEDHRHFLDLLTGGKDGTTDEDVFDDLYEQARQGIDIWEPARAARQAKRLKQSDFTFLINRADREPTATHPVKYWRNWLVGIMGDDTALEDFGARARKYDVLVSYDKFVDANPDATDEELEKEARRLVHSRSIIDMQQQLLSVTLPRFLIGTRMEPNVDETIALLDKKQTDGTLNESEYADEVARLRRLIELVERRRELMGTTEK